MYRYEYISLNRIGIELKILKTGDEKLMFIPVQLCVSISFVFWGVHYTHGQQNWSNYSYHWSPQ